MPDDRSDTYRTRFITVDDFGNVRFHKGEIPTEVMDAADDGFYSVVDITNPDDPSIYYDEGWTGVDPLHEEDDT